MTIFATPDFGASSLEHLIQCFGCFGIVFIGSAVAMVMRIVILDKKVQRLQDEINVLRQLKGSPNPESHDSSQ
jgi:hypothetical protein